MSTDEQGIFHMTEVEQFIPIKHNEIELTRYKKFQDSLEEVYTPFERERVRQERISNLKKWDAKQSGVWKEARLNLVKDQEASKKAEDILKSNGRVPGMFVRGEVRSGKSFFALAVARAMIGMGYASPSQVFHSSEDSMLAHLKGGFAGYSTAEEPLDSVYRLYIIDDVGHKDFYEEREVDYWERLLNHITKHNLTAIFTSSGSATGFQKKLPALAAARLDHLVRGRVISVKSVSVDLDDELDSMTPEERALMEAEEQKKKAMESSKSSSAPNRGRVARLPKK